MSSLMILAAAIFLRYRADKQTDRQTNAGKNPTPATAVGEGYELSNQLPFVSRAVGCLWRRREQNVRLRGSTRDEAQECCGKASSRSFHPAGDNDCGR